MKNKLVFVFLVMVILTIGIVAVGCENNTSPNTNDPKSIKITGITSTYRGREAGVQIFNAPEFGGDSVAREVYHSAQIDTGGTLLVDLKVSDGWDATDTPWKGSGQYYICLIIASSTGWSDDGGGDNHFFWLAKDGENAKYDIQNAVTTLDFSQFLAE
jgi:hypothetical protein